MIFLIKDEDNLKLDKFCNFLIERMQGYIYTNIDDRKLLKYTEYLNSYNIVRFNSNAKNYISARDILIGGTYNLKLRKKGDDYLIEIDKNAKIPFTYNTYYQLISLINYGNLQIPALNLYTEMLEYFSEKLSDYYNFYVNNGGVI